MEDYNEKPLSQVPLVILDTETTGLSPGLGHRIVELAAVRLENWQQVGRLNQLINPGRSMDPGASRVNGIRDEDLVNKPAFADVVAALDDLVEGALLVAHNARFDADFLAVEYAIAGRDSAGTKDVLPNPWLCTLQLARNCFYFGRNSLLHVAHQLGVRAGRGHRALNDAHITAEVLKRMVHELSKRRPFTAGDLLHMQGGPIYMRPVASPLLPFPLKEALARRTRVRILYVTGRTQTERTISPLYPMEQAGNVYLIAYCHLRREQRTFRVDRIIRAELVEG